MLAFTKDMVTEGETVIMDQLDEALARLPGRAQVRPYKHRVESACNEATADVIRLYGVELGSASQAVRDLIARGAASLAAERA